MVIAILALILVPLTLAGGESQSWSEPHVIAPLVLGVCLVPLFILWERWTFRPLVPFHLLQDRTVWGSLGLAWLLNFSWYMQGDYLYTVLVVAFDQTVRSATRITALYSLVAVIAGVVPALVVRFLYPYLKPWVIFGSVMFIVAFGLLIEYRSGTEQNEYIGVIAGQCVLGLAGGIFPHAAQVILQSAAQHEHLALVTGLFYAFQNFGGAVGNAVSGTIWTQILPGKLESQLAAVTSNGTIASLAYEAPLTGFVKEFPVGTLERTAVIVAYGSVQKLLCITAICPCTLLLFFAFVLQNPRVGKEQFLPDVRGSGDSSTANIRATSR